MSELGRASSVVALALCCGLLAGCGQEFPELTQDEYDLIVDYSAGVLSKYSLGNGDKLTRVPPLEEEAAAGPGGTQPSVEGRSDVPPVPAAQPASAGGETSPAAQPSDVAPEEADPAAEKEEPAIIMNQPEGDPTGAEPEKDPGVSGPAGGGTSDLAGEPTVAEEGTQETAAEETASEETSQGTGEAVGIESADSLLQRMQSGLSIAFNGYYVLNTYPESGAAYSLTADAGSRLMILSFTAKNTTGGAIDVDLLNANPTFTLYINGQPVAKQMVTVLENDMGTLVKSLGGGESSGTVLCFQIKEEQAKSIESLSLRMNYKGEEEFLQIE